MYIYPSLVYNSIIYPFELLEDFMLQLKPCITFSNDRDHMSDPVSGTPESNVAPG